MKNLCWGSINRQQHCHQGLKNQAIRRNDQTGRKRAACHFETGTVTVFNKRKLIILYEDEYRKPPSRELNSHCKIFASAASRIPSEVGRHEHFPSHHLDPSTDDVTTLRKINNL